MNLNPSAALLIAFALGACSGPIPDPTPATMESWRVVRVENPAERPGIIHYSGGQRFETALIRVEHLGELPARSKAPFLILAGYGCNDCDINRALYIHSPSDGPIQGGSHPRYTYPGSLTEWETPNPEGEIIEHSRAFVGECVANTDPVVLWVIETPSVEGQPTQRAEIVRVEADTLRLDSLEDPPSVLHAAERGVRSRLCREISPLPQMREP